MKKILKIIFIILVIFGALLEYGNLTGIDLKNKAIAIGYFSAVTYTFLFGILLKNNLQKLLTGIKNKRLLFTLIGTIGAVFVEFAIWFAQTKLNTTGAAISPNLWLDFIMTVPFYTLLAYLLSDLVLKYNFSWFTILIATGFYEVIADGVIGNLFQLNILGALISPVLLPLFCVFYSPIILSPYLILPKDENNLKKPSSADHWLLLKPVKAALIFPLSISLGLVLGSIFK